MNKIKAANRTFSLLTIVNPKKIYWGFVGILFMSAMIYFQYFGAHIFFFQENQSLFLFSQNYLVQFLDVPGGLIQYLSEFLKQFYVYTFAGAFIISVELVLLVLILRSIALKLNGTNDQTWILIFVPSLVLFFLHTDYTRLLCQNLGFLLVMLIYYLFLSINKKKAALFFLVSFPFLFYLLGGFVWILFVLAITHFFSVLPRKGRIMYSVLLTVVAGVTYVIFKEVIFVQVSDKLLFNPFTLGEDSTFPRINFILIVYFIGFPKLLTLHYFSKKGASTPVTVSLLSFLFFILGFSLKKNYKPEINEFMNLEKLVFEQKWDEVIDGFEKRSYKTLMSEYYYFIALSEKGILCDRMFNGNPGFGVESLIIPWEYKSEVINRGVYFYYTIGLMNEAHRWAFESMVTQGYQPENLKLIVKTNLVNGHYDVARKYISILKQTLFYRDWAMKYQKLCDHPEMLKNDPELGEKMSLSPTKDFFINVEKPTANLAYLLQANKYNKKVFEYGMAWALLSKNINAVAGELMLFGEMGYLKLPRHIEEAALIMQNINGGRLNEIGALGISKTTASDFNNYIAAYKKYRSTPKAESAMSKLAGDSFWYYMHFK